MKSIQFPIFSASRNIHFNKAATRFTGGTNSAAERLLEKRDQQLRQLETDQQTQEAAAAQKRRAEGILAVKKTYTGDVTGKDVLELLLELYNERSRLYQSTLRAYETAKKNYAAEMETYRTALKAYQKESLVYRLRTDPPAEPKHPRLPDLLAKELDYPPSYPYATGVLTNKFYKHFSIESSNQANQSELIKTPALMGAKEAIQAFKRLNLIQQFGGRNPGVFILYKEVFDFDPEELQSLIEAAS